MKPIFKVMVLIPAVVFSSASLATVSLTNTMPSISVAAEGQGDFSNGLISALTSTLGVTEEQANGGMGSILEVAKSALSNQEFKTLAASIPGVGDMLSAVPDVSSSSSDSASSMLGGFGGDSVKALTSALQINEQFEALGLDQEMIAQYVDMSLNYLQSEQGQQAADLLKKGLNSLL